MKRLLSKRIGVTVLTALVAASALVLCAAASSAAITGGGGTTTEFVSAENVGPAAPPTAERACLLPHKDGAAHTARVIETPEQLRWLMESASGEALAKCYILDLPSKSIDITSWTDTGIGACTQPSTVSSHHESCADAFCGGLDGNGTAIRFRVAESRGDGAKGELGLFPCLRGACVANLVLEVTQITDVNTNSNVYLDTMTGALCSYAGTLNGEPTIIEGISVTQHLQEMGDNWCISAGIVGYNDASIIRNCAVVSGHNVTATGEAAAEWRVGGYAGVCFMNSGSIDNCTYRYAGGENAVIASLGGITHFTTGEVLNCSVEIGGSNVSMSGGGITSRQDGGIISGCTAIINIAAFGSSDICGGIVGIVYSGKDFVTPSEAVIQDCTVTGEIITGGVRIGGLAGTIGLFETPNPYPFTMRDCVVELKEVGTLGKTVNVGGIAGVIRPARDMTIENCVSRASVYGQDKVGGLVGTLEYQEGEASAGTEFAPTRFTMTGCQNNGGRVEGRSYVGGAFGYLCGWDGYFSTYIAGCASYADVVSYDLSGGFAGQYSVKEPEVKSAERPYTFYDCHAYGGASASSTSQGHVGGFLGLSHKNARNFIVNSCSASGDVYSANTFAGGFLGGDAWKNQNNINKDAKNSYIDCSASGSVTADRNSAGGFVAFIAQSSNIVFSGCSATGDVRANSIYAAGFAADVRSPVTFTDCTAAGNVSAPYVAGGFAGRFLEDAEYAVAGAKFTFTRCYAYGDVTADFSADSLAADKGGSGGFLASFLSNSGNIIATDCAAYGSVQGVTVGGFFGRLTGLTSLELTRCEAYGDVNVNAKGEVGGFGAYLLGASGASAAITKCASYGAVKNCDATQTNWSDCAGFISILGMRATIDGCASYAPSVIGPDACSAAFLTIGDSAAAGTIIRNCSYTGFGADKKDKMTQAWGTGTAIPAANLVNNKFLGASAVIPANPKTATVDCVKSNDNGQCKITVTFGEGAQYKLKELAVSTDGGKTYTQLVSAGRVVAGVLPESVLTGTNFTYTYRAPYSTNFKVRVDAEVTRTVNGEKRTAPFQKIF